MNVILVADKPQNSLSVWDHLVIHYNAVKLQIIVLVAQS